MKGFSHHLFSSFAFLSLKQEALQTHSRPLGSSQKKRKQNRVMRILTLICFFHFSGLNNGYTYLTVVSPLHATQSVSLVKLVLGNAFELTSFRKMVSSVDQGLGFITGLALRVEYKARQIFNNSSPKVKVKAPTMAMRNFRPGIQDQEFQVNYVVHALQENYLKDEKEIWTKLEKRQDDRSVARISGIWGNIGFLDESYSQKVRERIHKSLSVPRKVAPRRVVYRSEADSEGPQTKRSSGSSLSLRLN